MVKQTKEKKQKEQKAQKEQEKKRNHNIEKSLWGFFIDKVDVVIFPLFLLVFGSSFSIIGVLALMKHAYNLGVLTNFLLGFFLSIEICFILFNINYKKEICILNVIGYKVLAIVWASFFYSIIAGLSFFKDSLGEILLSCAGLGRPLSYCAGVIILIIIYFLLNFGIAKLIGNK